MLGIFRPRANEATRHANAMEIQETHNRIRDQLAYLVTTVKGASAMGQTDIHRLSETVICPVLRIILRLPGLRNLNSEQRDFPGIDLGDPSAGVGIQVTARANASKIRETIRTCIRHGVHHTYPHLRFFVLTEKQAAYRLDVKGDLDGKLSFDPGADVLDYTDILGAVSTLGVTALSEVDEALQADLGFRSTPSAPRSVASAESPGWLNLLPITFPSHLYLGDTIPEIRSKKGSGKRNPRKRARQYLIDQGMTFSSDWTVYDGQIVTFHNLHQRDLPLARLVDAGTVTEFATDEYHSIDGNYRRAFKNLLRLCLQQLLYHRNVFWQHRAGLFCFGPRENGEEKRRESWTGMKSAKRMVFQQVPKRNAPDEIYYCKHFAFRAAFHVYNSTWYVSIKPEWFFSFDGYLQLAWGPEKVDTLKRIEKNQTVFNHVKFLAHFLGWRAEADLFQSVQVYPFLTFGPLTSILGLPQLDDNVWRSGEEKSIQKKLADPDGVIPLELGDV